MQQATPAEASKSFLLENVKFILASASPRRREIVAGVNWHFEIRAADIDETIFADEPPVVYAERMALAKARVIAARLSVEGEAHEAYGTAPNNDSQSKDSQVDVKSVFVLGADTIVTIDNQVLGKPLDKRDAQRMLKILSGRCHEVVTGIALIDLQSGESRVAHERTSVYFARLSDAEIEAYAQTDEPYDKAGAYAAQGKGCLLIERIEGDYWNVVGLPINLVYKLIGQM